MLRTLLIVPFLLQGLASAPNCKCKAWGSWFETAAFAVADTGIWMVSDSSNTNGVCDPPPACQEEQGCGFDIQCVVMSASGFATASVNEHIDAECGSQVPIVECEVNGIIYATFQAACGKCKASGGGH